MNRNRRPQRRFPQRQHVAAPAFQQRRNDNKLTVAKLQRLLTQDPNQIILSLASNPRALDEFLNQDIDYVLAELFVRVLEKSMKSISLKEKINLILSLFLKSNFPYNISCIILRINLSNERYVDFLQNLMHILKTILTQNPSEYLKILQITGAMNVILQHLGESRDDNIKNLQWKYEELNGSLQALVEKKMNQDTEEPSLPAFPPEDFRNLEIIPTAEAILSKGEIFLRKNKVKGSYDNVNHYLDVQFRLIREDFFGPLRHGIKQYLGEGNTQKHSYQDDLRIYHQVYILNSLCTNNGIAHKVSFDVSTLQINWEQSKRLIFGSLVCLTPDNFETFYFATVTERKIDEIKEGFVDLLFFSPCEDISRLPSTTVFIMAETTAYFEAYRHILKALKEINDDDMPFKEYIIHGKSDVKPPKYLTEGEHLKMNLACITDDCELVYHPKENVVQPKKKLTRNISLHVLHDVWPSAEILKLNNSQYQALQNALTKEFSLTQGPPGTGKTYIGLKIVKALCYNNNVWQKNGRSPMLLVCYTNQALDKFLEEIASFLKGGILRVGGRSQSQVLSPYSLQKLRETYRQEKYFSSEFMSTKHLTVQEKIDLKLEIEDIANQIKLTKKGILRESLLEEHMGHFYDWLVDGFENIYGHQNSSSMSVMTQWLGYGNVEVSGMYADLPHVDQEEAELQELPAETDVVDVYTEMDFIQQNRMIEDDESLHEKLFPALKINDDEILAINLDYFDREENFSSDGFEKTAREKKRLKKQLKKDLNSDILPDDEEVDQICSDHMWHMNKQKRWKLYRRWVVSYCEQLRAQIVHREMRYNAVCQAHKELLNYEDGEIMKNSLIIGMTTTGAAKYHALLQEIRPKIIIVEEAAEILEAHVITAMNPLCEQLILIGDHKQLRPNPNVYELARNYNLEVSLFERMVLNKCHVKCLSYQHRMRPEISQLLHPIYSELQDHVSVTKYENVKGLATNIYFIQHNEPEKTQRESRSYNNPHEASFVVELCKYLLKQGYHQSQITILTTYTAQLFLLRKLMKNEFFKGVRLTVVDNYQGEENDIILLSLVRNNVEKKVGFLKMDNRVCVALSRAKIGFYVTGNFEILSGQSKLWEKIVLMLKSKDLIGYALTLCCSNHPYQKTQVRKQSDFAQVPEGGCLKPCESRLKCGHTCKRLCHPVDDHDEYKCLETCPLIAPDCPQNHKCTHVCSKKCTPCMKMVAKIIPKCDHQQLMPCSKDPNSFSCKQACQARLPCGHQCMESCGDFCTTKCNVYVKKTYPCKHTKKSPCFEKYCSEKCPKLLDCGHKCSSICGKCSDKRIHSLCSEGCRRLLVCGHQCASKQCNDCQPCLKTCQNRCIHNKCMRLCGELCVSCKEPCEWRCKHYKCSRYCHEPCDRPKCDQPCLELLQCGHQCVGLCGEKCPRLCRECNKEELTDIFFGTEEEEDAHFVELEDCGHIFESSGLDEWMSQETKEIQLKLCPRCKVPIRRNLRYGQIINKILMDIDMVKDKLIGDRQQINALILQIRTDLYKLPRDYRGHLQNEWHQSRNNLSTLFYWNSFSYRISFILALCKLKENEIGEEDLSLQKHCEDFSKWLLFHREIFSKTELEEIEMEIERIQKIHKFYKIKKEFQTMSISKESNAKHLERGLQLLTSEDYAHVKDEVSEIEKVLSKTISGISEEERIQIVKAMGLTPGHWFKCKNGHVYAIGDCGGAMESTKCPDCDSTIGGERHTLAEGNTLAGEMDGARYAAWSEQANLANYLIDRF